MKNSKFLIVPLALALAACAPSAPEPAATAPAATVPAETAAPAPAEARTGIWFEPAALSACAAGKDVITVNWDVSADPSVASIQIVVLESNGTEGMFAATGPKGSKETGAWMGPGKTMAVRNAADGKELARATVEAGPCPAP